MKKILLALELLLYKWLLFLIAAVRFLIKKCRQAKTQEAKGHRPYSNACCVPIKSSVYKKPDPTIYDQYYLMALGIAVTWDNPDIQLYYQGAPVSSEDLLPATEYQVVARIWNNSTQAVAAGLPVKLSYLSFGVGTTSHAITSTHVNLGVKGGAFCPAYATMNWTTPAIPGHYCLQVDLIWADDANPNNNLGQENTHVGIAQSPANFSFQLKNPDRIPHTFHFNSDSFVIPRVEIRDSDEREKKLTSKQKWERQLQIARRRNNVTNFPIPPGWSVIITPDQLTLGEEEEQTIGVSIEPPQDFVGRQAINIHAVREDRSVAGGVTLYVVKS